MASAPRAQPEVDGCPPAPEKVAGCPPSQGGIRGGTGIPRSVPGLRRARVGCGVGRRSPVWVPALPCTQGGPVPPRKGEGLWVPAGTAFVGIGIPGELWFKGWPGTPVGHPAPAEPLLCAVGGWGRCRGPSLPQKRTLLPARAPDRTQPPTSHILLSGAGATLQQLLGSPSFQGPTYPRCSFLATPKVSSSPGSCPGWAQTPAM